MPIEREIKWAYLWHLRYYQKSKKEIPAKKDFKFLERYDYHDLIAFVEQSLTLLEEIKYKKVTKYTLCKPYKHFLEFQL